MQFLYLLLIIIVQCHEVFATGITTPPGGYRHNRCADPEFLQIVSYPASDVNVDENQCVDNLISGSFAPGILGLGVSGESGDEGTTDGEVLDAESTLEDAVMAEGEENAEDTPATLVVNGANMPLKMNVDSFERPYAFGTGSNSVEVRHLGKSLKRQFYETNTTLTKPDMRIILSWNTDGTDLDLHVVTPDGEHCWYGQRALKNGGTLDIDVTTGYGPEIYTMAAPVPGLYGVYVNYYGSGEDEMTVVKVDVILHESTIDERHISKTVPLSREGDLVSVASFVY